MRRFIIRKIVRPRRMFVELKCGIMNVGEEGVGI